MGNHTGSRSRRADKAQHGALHKHLRIAVRKSDGHSCQRNESKHLKAQQHEMPSSEAQVVRRDPVELQEKHHGYQHRLHILRKSRHSRLDIFCQIRHVVKHEICCRA